MARRLGAVMLPHDDGATGGVDYFCRKCVANRSAAPEKKTAGGAAWVPLLGKVS